jgi:hypothetical protein
MEDNNTTGQDRIIRSSFQITVHGYLLPKIAGNQVTTKRVVSMNKVTFGQEAYRDIETPFKKNSDIYDSGQFRSLNTDSRERLEDLQRRLNDFGENGLNNSPEVYPTEFD